MTGGDAVLTNRRKTGVRVCVARCGMWKGWRGRSLELVSRMQRTVYQEGEWWGVDVEGEPDFLAKHCCRSRLPVLGRFTQPRTGATALNPLRLSPPWKPISGCPENKFFASYPASRRLLTRPRRWHCFTQLTAAPQYSVPMTSTNTSTVEH